MSTIATLAVQLRKVNEQIAILEDEAPRIPAEEAPFLEMELNSFLRRRGDLQAQFEATAQERGISVCTYRAFGTGTRSFAKVCRVVAEFQKLYTLIFSALRSGPRSRRQVPADDELQSTFGFGYTFTGSVGVTLTLPRELLLFGDSAEPDEFDRAMDIFCELARLASPDAIKRYAADLGVGVIRELYEWSTVHSDNSLGADVKWLPGGPVKRSVLVEPKELSRLSLAIGMLSDVQEELPITVDVKLVGADLKTHEFHFDMVGGTEMRGTFVDAITDEHPLGHTYRAVLRRRRTVKYSTDEERVEWQLDRLTST